MTMPGFTEEGSVAQGERSYGMSHSVARSVALGKVVRVTRIVRGALSAGASARPDVRGVCSSVRIHRTVARGRGRRDR